MTLENDFITCSEKVKNLKKRPSNDELLELYALFKQAKEGDVQGKRPGMLDLKGRAKYDTWAKFKGMESQKAMESYVALVKNLQEIYG
ncbi:MAG: acyl-CoA-binding protein [Bdellovibrionales bacterium]|jgi:diazepam-binding inhibitor (GABA receptor modulating acyl-CoA-binding protein)|nr:acyl-CoA-binding protein [Bdellovibrionales bacterium]